MRIGPRWFALVLGFWGVLLALLGREAVGTGCPLGSCPACGACLEPPRAESPAQEDRIA